MSELIRELGRRLGAEWATDKTTSRSQLRNLARSVQSSGFDEGSMRAQDLEHYIGVMLNGQNHGVAIGFYEAITGDKAGSWRDSGLREFWDYHIGEGEWEKTIEQLDFGVGFVEGCSRPMVKRLEKAET